MICLFPSDIFSLKLQYFPTTYKINNWIFSVNKKVNKFLDIVDKSNVISERHVTMVVWLKGNKLLLETSKLLQYILPLGTLEVELLRTKLSLRGYIPLILLIKYLVDIGL